MEALSILTIAGPSQCPRRRRVPWFDRRSICSLGLVIRDHGASWRLWDWSLARCQRPIPWYVEESHACSCYLAWPAAWRDLYHWSSRKWAYLDSTNRRRSCDQLLWSLQGQDTLECHRRCLSCHPVVIWLYSDRSRSAWDAPPSLEVHSQASDHDIWYRSRGDDRGREQSQLHRSEPDLLWTWPRCTNERIALHHSKSL